MYTRALFITHAVVFVNIQLHTHSEALCFMLLLLHTPCCVCAHTIVHTLVGALLLYAVWLQRGVHMLLLLQTRCCYIRTRRFFTSLRITPGLCQRQCRMWQCAHSAFHGVHALICKIICYLKIAQSRRSFMVSIIGVIWFFVCFTETKRMHRRHCEVVSTRNHRRGVCSTWQRMCTGAILFFIYFLVYHYVGIWIVSEWCACWSLRAW